MLSARNKALVVILLALAVGGLLGASATYLWVKVSADSTVERRDSSSRRSGNGRSSVEEMVARLERDAQLDLTPQQREQIAAIMQQTGERFREAEVRSKEASSKIRDLSREQIRQVLTPEQTVRFDETMERWRERWRKHRSEEH